MTKLKNQTNTNTQKPKTQMEAKPNRAYDLEERSYEFARDIRSFVKQIPRTVANVEDGRQLIRASGSVGANYIEANESLGKKDFIMRLRIARKEAKESRDWLRLMDTGEDASLSNAAVSYFRKQRSC